MSIFLQKNLFLPIFLFLTKLSIFHKNFNFLPKFQFFTKILIFYQNFNFVTKISILWPKFQFRDQNFYFWQKFKILTNIWIFIQTVDFSRNIIFYRFIFVASFFGNNPNLILIRHSTFFKCLCWSKLVAIYIYLEK